MDLLIANPYIDKIHLYSDSIAATIRELKSEQFDYIIDLHNNLRTLLVKLRLNVKSYSYNKLNFQKLLFTSFKINSMPDLHIVDRNLATLKPFDVINDGKGLEHFVPEEDLFPITELPENFRNGYVVLVLAGTYATKRMPAEKYRKLISETNFPFILLGGKGELTMAHEILSWNTGNVLSFTGKLRLNQSASLVKQARLVVTNDTGLMHIAAAYHKKILSIWGNTSPQFGMYPYLPGKGSEVLEVKDLSCRPCSKLGYRQCPKKHFKCMNDISEDRMIDWVKREF
jgi:ADP-heptose:LPS heptosyltransferase